MKELKSLLFREELKVLSQDMTLNFISYDLITQKMYILTSGLKNVTSGQKMHYRIAFDLLIKIWSG